MEENVGEIHVRRVGAVCTNEEKWALRDFCLRNGGCNLHVDQGIDEFNLGLEKLCAFWVGVGGGVSWVRRVQGWGPGLGSRAGIRESG